MAQNLREWALIYRAGSFLNVAKILEDASKEIESGVATEQALNQKLVDLERTLWQEFCQNLGFKKSILDDVNKIIVKGSPQFQGALTILERTKSAQETVRDVSLLAAQQKDPSTQLYLLCFLYLILIEGVYDEAMRFLYAIHLRLPSTNADLNAVRDRFLKDRIGLSLFDGWDSTIRNAIGHATFSLDTSSRVARFEDKRSGQIRTPTFDEFRTLSQKVFDVPTAIQVLLILRVLVPLNFSYALKAISSLSSS